MVEETGESHELNPWGLTHAETDQLMDVATKLRQGKIGGPNDGDERVSSEGAVSPSVQKLRDLLAHGSADAATKAKDERDESPGERPSERPS